MYRRLENAFNSSRVEGSAQKVFKNFKVGGTDLVEQNVTEGFQGFQSRGKWLKCNDSRVEKSDLSAQKVIERFQKF